MKNASCPILDYSLITNISAKDTTKTALIIGLDLVKLIRKNESFSTNKM